MNTPNGTKRVVGLITTFLAFILPQFGYGLSEVAPVEMARFADGLMQIAGLSLILYGEYKAKAPLWFSKVNKEKS